MFGLPKYIWTFFPLLLFLSLGAWLSPVWYDDAGHFIVIMEGLWENGFCYPSTGGCDPNSPFITLGRPLNIAYAIWMMFFGDEMLAGRIFTMLFSCAAILAMGELGRRYFSEKKAVWAILLVIGNVQFMTYGAQILGEVPMLAFLLWGLLAHAEGKKRVMWGAMAPVFWFGAVMCKAYIAVPIAVGVALWLVVLLVRGEKRQFWGAFAQAMVWGLGLIVYFVVEQGGLSGFQEFLRERGSYGSEFFAFDFVEALRYLAFKPLFWLGTGALLMRLRFQRRTYDYLLGAFHLALSIFFLFSAGYDRFGFLLLFIPALYFSEFMAAAWTRLKKNLALRVAFALLAILVFYQQTPLIYGRRLLHPDQVNRAEKELFSLLIAHPYAETDPPRVFTYDQQIVPFNEYPVYRLPATVPSNAANCEPLELLPRELFVEGEYARTVYKDCVPWESLVAFDSVEHGGTKYVLWESNVRSEDM